MCVLKSENNFLLTIIFYYGLKSYYFIKILFFLLEGGDELRQRQSGPTSKISSINHWSHYKFIRKVRFFDSIDKFINLFLNGILMIDIRNFEYKLENSRQIQYELMDNRKVSNGTCLWRFIKAVLCREDRQDK